MVLIFTPRKVFGAKDLRLVKCSAQKKLTPRKVFGAKKLTPRKSVRRKKNLRNIEVDLQILKY